MQPSIRSIIDVRLAAILLAFLLPLARLFSQSPAPPFTDSSGLWVEIRPETDSLFTLRVLFLNKKTSPSYLFWRSHLKKGFDLKKNGGDFVALPGDSTPVFFQNEKWEPGNQRVLEFYVLDNDQMVNRFSWKFSDADEIMKNRKTPVLETPKQANSNDITTTTEASAQPAVASSPTPKPSENNTLPPEKQKPFLAKDDFEIDGIVTNDTRTAFGRQFFQFFSEKWEAPTGTGGWWISIKEILTPGRFTLVSVSLNNRELFQRYLNPNTDYLKNLAGQTADLLADILKNGDPDGGFSADDLNGKLVE